MSYIRMGIHSDVYVFENTAGFIECCMCNLKGKKCPECGDIKVPTKYAFDSVQLKSRSEMLSHLENHRKKGHKVPQRALKAIKQVIREEGDEVRKFKSRRMLNPTISHIADDI